MACALMALTLTGCGPFGASQTPSTGSISVRLALPPGELRGCFDRLVPAPGAGALTRRQIVELVAALRQSEVSKSQCGRQLLGWYDTYSASLGGT